MAFDKFFNKTQLISDINGKPWNEVVEAFRQRIVGWWFEPFADWPKTGHEAFPVLLSMCLVIRILAKTRGALKCSFYDISYSILGHEEAAARLEMDVAHNLYERGKLSDAVGITGLGDRLFVEDDGKIIYDPWQLRDAALKAVDNYCDALIAVNGKGKMADSFKEYLQVEFGIEVASQETQAEVNQHAR